MSDVLDYAVPYMRHIENIKMFQENSRGSTLLVGSVGGFDEQDKKFLKDDLNEYDNEKEIIESLRKSEFGCIFGFDSDGCTIKLYVDSYDYWTKFPYFREQRYLMPDFVVKSGKEESSSKDIKDEDVSKIKKIRKDGEVYSSKGLGDFDTIAEERLRAQMERKK